MLGIMQKRLVRYTVFDFKVTATANLRDQPIQASLFASLYADIAKPKIILAGGFMGTFIKACQLYDINTDKWTLLPQLQQPKINSSLCLMKERYLFCFGGHSDILHPYLIEMLDLKLMLNDQTWKSINTKPNVMAYVIGCFPVLDDSAILFSRHNDQRDIYKFTFKEERDG